MADNEAVVLLRSIDASLKALLIQTRTAGTSAALASEREMSGPYADPEVKWQPRDWSGENCKGRLFSQCPPDFLEMLAESLDYFAGKSEEANEMTKTGKPVGPYKRLDARRARTYAKRIREGHTPQTAPAVTDPSWPTTSELPPDDSDNIPF